MKTSLGEVLTLARRELGITEYPPGSNDVVFTRWHGHVGWAWCNIFVDWVLKNACAQNSEKSPLEGIDFPYGPAYTGDTMVAGQRHTNGLGWSDYPVLGSLVIYDWDWAGMTDHIGIVSWTSPTDRNLFKAIEGNTSPDWGGSQSNGGGVYERTRRNDRGYVRGFVTVPYGTNPAPPKYPTNIPAWPGRVLALTTPFMTGGDVKTWQQRMSNRGWSIGTDGVYGPGSAQVCRQFQAEKHLAVDGQVGPVTWLACFRNDNIS